MKIRSHTAVSLDGFMAGPDGMPTWNSAADFFASKGASHGYPEFIENCEAVIIGRATFDQGYGAPSWPWPDKTVYVLTSQPLPSPLPEPVVASRGDVKDFIAQVRAGVKQDAQLLGGARTIRAFFEQGAIDELGLITVPVVLGGGVPLWTPGLAPRPIKLQRQRSFVDGSVHAVYSI